MQYLQMGLVQYDGKLKKDMPIEVAFKRGLKTWAKMDRDKR